jgi:hypothetical protein
VDLNPVERETIEEAQRKALEHDSPLAGIIIRLEAIPFIVPAAGRILFELVVGEEVQLCGTINFQLGQDAANSTTNVLPPPV